MSNNRNYKNIKDLEEESKTKNQLLELLKQGYPNIFNDGVLDLEKFKQEIGLENDLESKEKYGLNWVGKSKAFYETNKISNKTLIPLKDKSMNFEQSDNLIIEGDNLEVLKLLEKHYFNRIDVIYIDPPYNTGNDFVYKDNFKQSKHQFDVENDLKDEEGNKLETKNSKSNGHFHTDWLNMLYPRLILAKKLLKKDGVIFISIDDNEQARLKLVCDEIFGEQNFVSNLIWRKKNTGGGSDKITIQNEIEYILIYSKNSSLTKFNSQPIDLSKYKLQDNYFEERGYYNLTDLDRVSSSSSFQYIESLDYEIEAPDGTKFKNFRNMLKPKSYRYTLGKELFDFYNKNGFIEIKKNKNGFWQAYRKSYSKVTIDRELKKIIPRVDGNSYNNLINNSSITTSNGKRELIKILKGNKDFSFPKPTCLIKHILKIASKPDSLILDFFAGSGTTGQAVMELNKEDGGNRKYILVQYPEKIENSSDPNLQTIFDITCERIKRSIDMYQYKESGFKAFKLVDSNFKTFDANPDDDISVLEQKMLDIENKVKEDTKVEDLIYELILKHGLLPLNEPIHSKIVEQQKIYFDESKTALFILEPINNEKYYDYDTLIKTIKDFIDQQEMINIFLRDNYFKNDEDKINFSNSIDLLKENRKELKIEIWVI
ncbi:MAG: site-specific DNA-methyltransferase [Mycoplasmataceae bacterium]|nr:site-specific DNA-methyltransferase [Mycoplasmataceae bacterium]